MSGYESSPVAQAMKATSAEESRIEEKVKSIRKEVEPANEIVEVTADNEDSESCDGDEEGEEEYEEEVEEEIIEGESSGNSVSSGDSRKVIPEQDPERMAKSIRRGIMRQSTVNVPEEYHHLFDTGSGSDDPEKDFKADAAKPKTVTIKRTITRKRTFNASDGSGLKKVGKFDDLNAE